MSAYDEKLNTPAESTAEKQQQDGRGVEPSGYKGSNPATAGPGKTDVQSGTPENKEGHLNPSAPEDSNATPGSTGVK